MTLSFAGQFPGATRVQVAVHDAFIVKYCAGTMPEPQEQQQEQQQNKLLPTEASRDCGVEMCEEQMNCDPDAACPFNKASCCNEEACLASKEIFSRHETTRMTGDEDESSNSSSGQTFLPLHYDQVSVQPLVTTIYSEPLSRSIIPFEVLRLIDIA